MRIPRQFVQYDKKTDEWSAKAIFKEIDVYDEIEYLSRQFDWTDVRVNRKQLDAFSRLIQYLWHDKIDEYLKKADPERRKQIKRDAKDIDEWLATQYKNLKKNKGDGI